jgi:uncharacterized protein YndB with AHSA1/START domain
VTRTISIAPVRKRVVVQASTSRAFDVFTTGIDRWWPRHIGIGTAPVRESVIEPFVGGRWYTKCEDGTEAVVGHVRVWQPGRQFVVSWEINGAWKPDARPDFTSEVEVRFVDEGAGMTRVELEHRGFERMDPAEGEKMRNEVNGGWPSLLEAFAKAAAGESK